MIHADLEVSWDPLEQYVLGVGLRVMKTPGDALRNAMCYKEAGGGGGVWIGAGQCVWVETNENKWSDKVKRLRSRLKDPPPLSISNLGD